MCFLKAIFYDKTKKYFNTVLILKDKFIRKDKACMCVPRTNYKYYPHLYNNTVA